MNEKRPLREVLEAMLDSKDCDPYAHDLGEALNDLVRLAFDQFETEPLALRPDLLVGLRPDVMLGRRLMARALILDLAASLAINVYDYEVPW